MLCSSKIVHLRASGTSNSRYLAVHLELLCFLLPYFRAAFKGGFQEREKDSLDVEVSQHVLEIVVAWMYTGQLTGEHCLYARTLIDVYIFADKFEFLALRRSIIRPAAFRRYKGCRFCSSYSTVSHAYRNLPSNSPLLRFIEKTYIQHWRCDVDEDPIDHSDRAAAPPEFLSAVLYGRDKMLRDAQDKRSKGDENAMSDMQKCACCNDVCLFHEHQSEEERKACKCRHSYTIPFQDLC